MNYSRVILAGNLTRDPELRYLQNGTGICKIGIAINREWKSESGEKKSETVFADVDFWGKTGETISKFFKKGQPIFVEGRLKLEQWDDKQTGQKRSRLGITGENFQFIGSKNESAGDSTGSRASRPSAAPTNPAPTPAASEPLPEDDDVPF